MQKPHFLVRDNAVFLCYMEIKRMKLVYGEQRRIMIHEALRYPGSAAEFFRRMASDFFKAR